MAYPISAGVEISLEGTNWYKLTDHNRSPISMSPELIESAQRMANGKMRKYVIAQKNTISIDWKYVPTKTSECVDGNQGPAWIESFYNSHFRLPVWVRIVSSEIEPSSSLGFIPENRNYKTSLTGSQQYYAFITGFSKTIVHRTRLTDYVDMTIEFTEI